MHVHKQLCDECGKEIPPSDTALYCHTPARVVQFTLDSSSPIRRKDKGTSFPGTKGVQIRFELCIECANVVLASCGYEVLYEEPICSREAIHKVDVLRNVISFGDRVRKDAEDLQNIARSVLKEMNSSE